MELLRPRIGEEISSTEPKQAKKRRRRSMTTLKLQWVAERVRKARQIKILVDNGSYHVDSKEVAKSLIGLTALKEEEV